MINSLGISVSGLFCGVMRIRGSGSGFRVMGGVKSSK